MEAREGMVELWQAIRRVQGVSKVKFALLWTIKRYKFQKEAWWRDSSLRVSFQFLYAIASSKVAQVANEWKQEREGIELMFFKTTP